MPELIDAAQITYLEGYLFDPPRAQEAFRKAAAIAHARRPAGRAEPVRPVLRRSPPRRVPRAGRGRGRYPVRQRGRNLLALRDRRFRAGRRRGARPCRDRGADPQRAWQRRARPAGGEAHDVAAAPVDRVVDTTGAGDLYAAGFLYGLTRGLPLPTCGAIGSLCAAEIISHVGARPEAALRELSRRRVCLSLLGRQGLNRSADSRADPPAPASAIDRAYLPSGGLASTAGSEPRLSPCPQCSRGHCGSAVRADAVSAAAPVSAPHRPSPDHREKMPRVWTSATSRSSRMSITARRRWSISCCARAARSAPTSRSPSAPSIRTSWSASAASRSSPNAPRSVWRGRAHQHRRYAGPRRFRRRGRAHPQHGRRRPRAGRRRRGADAADQVRRRQGAGARV